MDPNTNWQHQARDDRGRWGEMLRAEANLDLDELEGVDSPTGERIRQLVNAERDVAAIGLGSAPIDSTGAQSWWDRHAVIAEHRKVGSDAYPRIPERLAGGRRVSRRQYTGAGVHLQMPAAAAIRRFSADAQGSFDVPVRADLDGRTADAWVRVTRTEQGGYRAVTLGIPGEHGSRVAEAVSAVLESRRVSVALEEAGDLVERARQRTRQATGARQQAVASWITSAGYDEATGTSTITISGKPYGFAIPRELHDQVYGSTAPGTLFNMLVKNKAERVQVESCDRCGRIRRAGTPHDCGGVSPAWGVETGNLRDRAAAVLARTLRIRRPATERTTR